MKKQIITLSLMVFLFSLTLASAVTIDPEKIRIFDAGGTITYSDYSGQREKDASQSKEVLNAMQRIHDEYGAFVIVYVYNDPISLDYLRSTAVGTFKQTLALHEQGVPLLNALIFYEPNRKRIRIVYGAECGLSKEELNRIARNLQNDIKKIDLPERPFYLKEGETSIKTGPYGRPVIIEGEDTFYRKSEFTQAHAALLKAINSLEAEIKKRVKSNLACEIAARYENHLGGAGSFYEDSVLGYTFTSDEEFSVFYNGRNIKNFDGNAASFREGANGLEIHLKGKISMETLKGLLYAGQTEDSFTKYSVSDRAFDILDSTVMISHGTILHQIGDGEEKIVPSQVRSPEEPFIFRNVDLGMGALNSIEGKEVYGDISRDGQKIVQIRTYAGIHKAWCDVLEDTICTKEKDICRIACRCDVGCWETGKDPNCVEAMTQCGKEKHTDKLRDYQTMEEIIEKSNGFFS